MRQWLPSSALQYIRKDVCSELVIWDSEAFTHKNFCAENLLRIREDIKSCLAIALHVQCINTNLGYTLLCLSINVLWIISEVEIFLRSKFENYIFMVFKPLCLERTFMSPSNNVILTWLLCIKLWNPLYQKKNYLLGIYGRPYIHV